VKGDLGVYSLSLVAGVSLISDWLKFIEWVVSELCLARERLLSEAHLLSTMAPFFRYSRRFFVASRAHVIVVVKICKMELGATEI
jgi:hypothetical protein